MGAPSINQINIIDGNTVDVVASETILQDANFFLAANWVLTGGALPRTVSTVTGPASNTARLVFSPEMKTGETLTVTPDVAVVSLSTGEPFSPTSGDWISIGDPPVVSSAAATGIQAVRVTFNEPMSQTPELGQVGTYSVVAEAGVPAATVTFVLLEAVALPTYVDLTLAVEMTDGAQYDATVQSPFVQDEAGNPLDPFNNTAQFSGLGVKPKLLSLSILELGRRVRFTFDEPMSRDAALSSISNYSFNTVTPGAIDLFITEVVLPDIPASPSHVDALCSEMTIAANYEAVVSSTGPTDVALNTVDPANNTLAFVGVGINPLVALVRGVSQNRADVEFNESMRGNVDIHEASRYTWDQGLVTLSVLEVTENVVKLVTSDQAPGTLYNLTIDPT